MPLSSRDALFTGIEVSKTYRRTADIPTADATTSHDFKIRERRPSLPTILITFLFTFGLICILASSMDSIGGVYVFAPIIFTLLALIGWFVIHVTQVNRDLVLVTEFQNALFSAVANINSLFLLIVKSNGTITYHSNEYKKLFANSRKYGFTSLDSLLDNDGIGEESANKIRAAMEDERPEVVHGNLVDVEGNRHEVRLSLRPIARPSGYFLISCSPLRRRMADSQTQSGQNAIIAPVMSAINSAAMPICIFSKSGAALFVHHDIEKWLGYDVGEIMKSKLSLSTLIQHDNAGYGTGNFEGEVTFKKRSGAPARAFVLQRVFTDSDGNAAGCCSIIAPADMPNPFRYGAGNIEASSGDMSYLNALLDHAPLGIALLNRSGGIVRYNSLFASLTECSARDELNIATLLKGESRDEVAKAIESAAGGVSMLTPASVMLNTSGKRTAALYITNLPASNGSDIAMVAYLNDTTEQKNLEEKYAHSQKMQAVGQLAGGIAHDFNNLLTAMIGFCDLLLMRHPAGDQSFADIMQIKQNANRAANLVRQLLAFSRRQTLQPKVLDVTDVLAELSDLIRRLIGEHIELSIVHGRDLGMVKVDQGQFEQVIINLAVNARDAMSGGGILTVKTRNTTVNRSNRLPHGFIQPADDDPIVDGDYVVVEVSDNGHGIPPDIITKIFEPFFSTKAIGSGTGLGLATVYGIVKQTGGYIFVNSRPNEGTSFALYFKRYQVEQQPQPQHSEQATPAAPVGDLTGKSTILLVEDEAPVRIFSARALRNKGYTVLEAENAEAGLAIINEQGTDIEIIVTDVIMPGMDGPSMVKEVWEKYPEVEVIFISGYAEDALVKMEDSKREYSFLPKPFTLKQLAEKVKEVADKKTRAAA